jgi:hypothetical protein
MTIKVKKLDKRNTGYGKFKYAVNSTSLYAKEFYEIRAWMWDTWGASKELKDWMLDYRIVLADVGCQNEHWCWQSDEYNRRLFLRTDKELILFRLRWE